MKSLLEFTINPCETKRRSVLELLENLDGEFCHQQDGNINVLIKNPDFALHVRNYCAREKINVIEHD